jgi:surface antigen
MRRITQTMESTSMKLSKCLAIAAMFLMASGQAIAANTSFMNDSVLAELRDDDVTMLLGTIDEALELPQGEASHWENKASGAKGTITRLGGFSKEGRECRKLRVETQARGRSSDSEWDYCRAPYGRWELTPR